MTTTSKPVRPSAARPTGRAHRGVVAGPWMAARAARAFSLFEMVVVIGLIGLLAALALPSLKMGKGNQMNAATRQLLDDLALARLRAINNRSQVYVVFLPKVWSYLAIPSSGPVFDFFTTNQAANHLLGSQLAAYAIYAKRSLGDQPGQPTSRYMSEWKTLPDGIFIGNSTTAVQAITNTAVFCNVINNVPRPLEGIPFPDTTPGNPVLQLPYIAFSEQGRIVGPNADIRIPLAIGSLLPARTATGTFQVVDVDALETPRLNSVTNYNRIVISYQTGRARVERPELP